MDDTQLAVGRKKLAALDKQLSDLAIKQRTTESRLAGEHELIRKSAAERATVVARLVDADEQAAAKLHKQLDGLDQQIKSSERQAEAYQHALKAIASETATITADRNKLNEAVGVEINQRDFRTWQSTMTANFAAAREAMAAARIALGKLTVEAAKGTERFKGLASTWAAGEFDQFERVEANPDSLGGFKLATPWYRNVLIHIAPMERR